MIDYKGITDINNKTPDGQMLMAAIAILTTISEFDIKQEKWGSKLHPDHAVEKIADLCNKIYHKEEWEQKQKELVRDQKIENILNKSDNSK